jgi:hypothetical protein
MFLAVQASKVFMDVELVRKYEMGLEKGRWLQRKLLLTVLKRGETSSKTQTAIHAAAYFRPFHAFMHFEPVRKHETGLEKGR